MIRCLSADVQAYIRTGVALTSIAQGVEELVLNSIDAGATNIAVRVDLSCFKVQVVDNGAGITLDQFHLVGERYSTSKCHTVEDIDNLKYFGYRGEALASLRKASSILEITSRPKTSSVTHSKCFQSGEVLDIIESPLPRPSAGTTVTAHDLFYNMPVRRKCMNEGLEMEKIRYRLAGIALVWPQISISLRDDAVGHVILQTRKCSGMVAVFSTIFTPTRTRRLMEVSAEKDEFKMFGVVSKEGYSRKDLQFVFINRRLVLKSSIHKQVNKILGRSLILRRKGLTSDIAEKLPSAVGATSGSPTKQAERYGIFAINVECPFSAYDITFDPAKTLVEFRDWPKLIHLLQDMLYGFLRKENLIFVPDPTSCSTPDNGDNSSDDENEEENDNSSRGDDNNSVKECGSFMPAEKTDTVGDTRKVNLDINLDNCLFSKPAHRRKQQALSKSTENNGFVIPDIRKQSIPITSSPAMNTVSSTERLLSTEDILCAVCPPPVQCKASKFNSSTTEISFDQAEKPETHEDPSKNFKETYKRFHEASGGGVESKISRKHCDSSIQQNSKALSSRQTSREHISIDHCQAPTAAQGLSVTCHPQLTQIKKKTEITLGNSVHYSSTLKYLRDINPTSSSTRGSEIITDTLQQLRNSTLKAKQNEIDLYKTPVKHNRTTCLDDDHPSPPKLSKLEGKTSRLPGNSNLAETLSVSGEHRERRQACPNGDLCINGSESAATHSLRQEIQLTTSTTSSLGTSHNNKQPLPIYRTTTEERARGRHDREACVSGSDKSQKQPGKHNQSHSARLARLMRGEKLQETAQETTSDTTKLLQSFSFSRQNRHTTARYSTSNAKYLSSIVASGNTNNSEAHLENRNKMQSLNTDFNRYDIAPTSSFVQNSADDESGYRNQNNVDYVCKLISPQNSYSGRGTTNQFNTESENVTESEHSRKSGRLIWQERNVIRGSKSDLDPYAVPHCQDHCRHSCQCQRQAEISGNTLPFSMYQSPEHVQLAVNGAETSPKVSVILSLPIDSGKFETAHSLNVTRPLAKPIWCNNPRTLTGGGADIHASSSTANVNSSTNEIEESLVTESQGFSVQNSESYNNEIKSDVNLDTLANKELQGVLQQQDISSMNSHAKIPLAAHGCGEPSPQLSQGFCPSSHIDLSDGEIDERSNAEHKGSVSDSAGFSLVTERSPPDETQGLSSQISVENQSSDDMPTPEIDSDFFIVKHPQPQVQSPVTVSPSKLESQLIKEDSVCKVARVVEEQSENRLAQRRKPLHTCQMPDSSYFSKAAKSDACSISKGNSEELLEPAVLAYDSLTFKATTIAETENLDGSEQQSPNLQDISYSTTSVNNGNLTAAMAKNSKRQWRQEEEDLDSVMFSAKRVLKNMRNALRVNSATKKLFSPVTRDCSQFPLERTPPEIAHPQSIRQHESSSTSQAVTDNSLMYYRQSVNLCPLIPGTTQRGNPCCNSEPCLSPVNSSESNQRVVSSSGSLPCSQQDEISLSENNLLLEDNKSFLKDVHQTNGFEHYITDVLIQKDSENSSQNGGNYGSESLFENMEKDLHEVHQLEMSSSKGSPMSDKINMYDEFLNQEMLEDFRTGKTVQSDSELKIHTSKENAVRVEDRQLVPRDATVSMINADSAVIDTISAAAGGDSGDGKMKLTVSSASAINTNLSATDTVSGAARDNGVRLTLSAETISNDSATCQDRQSAVMSSAGDRALLMIDIQNLTECDRQSLNLPQTRNKNISGSDQNDNGTSACESDTSCINRQTHSEQMACTLSPDRTFASKFKERQGGTAVQSRTAISLSAVRPSELAPSSLLLLRPTPAEQIVDTDMRASRTPDSWEKWTRSDEMTTVDNKESGTGMEYVMSAKVSTTTDTTHETSRSVNLPDGKSEIMHPKDSEVVVGGQELEGNGHGSVSHKEPELQACWREVVESNTGQKTYVNNLSGHTVSEDQWMQMSSRLQREMLAITNAVGACPVQSPAHLSASGKQAMEDMVSRHFEQEDFEALSKWRGGKRPVYNVEAGADIATVIAKWSNPVFLNYKQPTLVAESCPSGTAARSCFNSLSQVEFTKDMLNNVQVIGQLDCKFIACLIEKPSVSVKALATMPENCLLLVLFDQHAVHERIRLEYLTRESYEVQDGAHTDRLKRSDISPVLPLMMDQDDVRIMKAFSKEFDRIGVGFTVEKTLRTKVYINSMPTCMLDKDGSDMKRNKMTSVLENVEQMIKEHIDLLKSTNGACGRLPLAIHKVLCSQACHGAVKFGDQLVLSECHDLLSSLASCNLPFQCAHGRPSVAPLINLSALESELVTLSLQKRPNLWKISQHFHR